MFCQEPLQRPWINLDSCPELLHHKHWVSWSHQTQFFNVPIDANCVVIQLGKFLSQVMLSCILLTINLLITMWKSKVPAGSETNPSVKVHCSFSSKILFCAVSVSYSCRDRAIQLLQQRFCSYQWCGGDSPSCYWHLQVFQASFSTHVIFQGTWVEQDKTLFPVLLLETCRAWILQRPYI